MKVKIIKTATAEEVDAFIKKGSVLETPSIQQGWRFNFDKELKKLKNATGYLLVTRAIAFTNGGSSGAQEMGDLYL